MSYLNTARREKWRLSNGRGNWRISLFRYRQTTFRFRWSVEIR